jgi:AraC-like DNA-binding protein
LAPAGKPGASDRAYLPTKLAAIVDALVADGVELEEALAGIGVSGNELHSPDLFVSVDQVMAACRNAVRLSRDPWLAFRIGSSMHLSAYGMYGYAILCSADFRKTMDFCVRYHVLATPLVALSFAEQNGSGIWAIDPIPQSSDDDRLYRFIVEMQLGVTLSLMRDVMGPSFAPDEIDLVYDRPGDPGSLEALAACSARYAQPRNRFVFDAKWLDGTARLGNRTTYANVLALCDELLASLAMRAGVAGKVRASLLADIASRPTLTLTAQRMETTERTLRRLLKQQGTSFRAVADELRAQLALKYLRETAMTNEDIAAALGFSDAANFRHAFRKWTGKSPSAFRRQPS